MKLKFKKGLTLNIAGPVDASAKPLYVDVASVAVCPDDYPGFIPKVAVKDGEAVAVGSPLLFDKKHPETKIVSPVAGSVKAIVRGERRKILRVEVDAGTEACVQPHFDKPSDKASAKRFLAESGLLALMRQRPYDIVPSPEDTVRDIFVTAIDSAPLAFPLCDAGDFLFEKEDYEAGIAVLDIVSEGKVYFCHDMSWTLGALSGAETIEVEGRHPAGNVSVQIAAIKPVDKGDVVWTLDVLTLGRIGRTLRTGVFAAETVVAVTGPEVSEPCLLGAVIGDRVAPLLAGRVADNGHSVRVVSGNLLTGTAIDASDGYLRYPYRQITVIANGDDVDEFMGWASLSPSKMSESRSFPGHFLKRLFVPDARLHGGRRAMIMSGQYESTLPMDILPEYLIKAILSHNIEEMEKLGIYEVAPEDFAAAEYVDTSKLPLQQIVRDGLDYLRKELE